MSNLLEKASVLTTATAYNDGKLLSVKPVPYFGSELVTNGTFDTDSNWFKDANWTIANGKATSTGVGRMFQSISFLEGNIGTTVKVSFDIVEVTSDGVKIDCYGATSEVITEVGTHSFIGTTTNSLNLYINNSGQGNLVGSIDNVSVKEVIDGDFDFTRNSSATRVASNGLIEDVQILSGNLVINGDFATDSDWTLGSNWSILNGIATSDGAGLIQQSTSQLTAGKTYKASFEITEYTSGGVKLYSGSGSDTSTYQNTVGTHVFYLVANGSTTSLYSNNFIGSIDNISLIEITDDTNLPRIDYTDGVGHILLEPQSTNLVTYSEVYGSGKYFSIASGSTIDNTTSLSPSGENNATELTSTGAGKLQTGGVSLSQNTDYTLSFYAKNVDATDVTSRILGIGGSGGSNLTEVSYFSQLSTTEWKRITHSFNTGTNTTFYLYLANALNSGGTIQLWGAQLEQLSFATSYIPTNGSTVTRLGETLNNAGSSDLINSTEGVLYAEISALANGGVVDRYISLSSGSDVVNTVQLLYHSTSNRVNFRVTKGGSFQVNISDFTFEQTDNLKIAVKFKENDFALWINGVERAIDTSGQTFSVGTLQKLQFDSGNRASDFYGKVKCVAVFKEALTDAELTCLTTI